MNLDLRGTKIDSLEDIVDLHFLETLDIAHTKITSDEFLMKERKKNQLIFPNLRNLTVSENYLIKSKDEIMKRRPGFKFIFNSISE